MSNPKTDAQLIGLAMMGCTGTARQAVRPWSRAGVPDRVPGQAGHVATWAEFETAFRDTLGDDRGGDEVTELREVRQTSRIKRYNMMFDTAGARAGVDVSNASTNVLVIGQYMQGLSKRNSAKIRKKKKDSNSLGQDVEDEYAMRSQTDMTNLGQVKAVAGQLEKKHIKRMKAARAKKYWDTDSESNTDDSSETDSSEADSESADSSSDEDRKRKKKKKGKQPRKRSKDKVKDKASVAAVEEVKDLAGRMQEMRVTLRNESQAAVEGVRNELKQDVKIIKEGQDEQKKEVGELREEVKSGQKLLQEMHSKIMQEPRAEARGATYYSASNEGRGGYGAGQNSRGGERRPLRCWICGELGHPARLCKNKNPQSREAAGRRVHQAVNRIDAGDKEEIEELKGQMEMNQAADSEVTMASVKVANEWIAGNAEGEPQTAQAEERLVQETHRAKGQQAEQTAGTMRAAADGTATTNSDQETNTATATDTETDVQRV